MICGVDEAGRGPVLGPLVVAGVCITNESILKNIGVKDSKKISALKRQSIAQSLINVVDNYKVLVIPASDIDDMRKVMTLNEVEVHAFSKVIKNLKPDICYVDAADVNAERFGNNISTNLSLKINIISKHKADDIYPIVSAASIIAKTYRDNEVKKISEILEKKMNLPLGSGYPADPITQTFLREWVKRFNKLPPHTRHSWKTAKNIFLESTNKKLDDF
jgi:ribonuclease HII